MLAATADGGGRTTRAAGFTLIEALVALVILSTGIVLVLQAFQTGASALGVAREAACAAHLTHQVLQTLPAARGTAVSPGGGVFPAPYEDFEWALSTENTGDESGAALEPIRVEVGRIGSSVRFVTQTYRCRVSGGGGQ